MATLICPKGHVAVWDTEKLERDAPKHCGTCRGTLMSLAGCPKCQSPFWRNEKDPAALHKFRADCGAEMFAPPPPGLPSVGGKSESMEHYDRGRIGGLPPHRPG